MSTVETLSPADQQYYCRLTDAGAALEAAAHAEAKPVRLTHVAVGDGGGIVPVPEASATALVSEVYRREIDGRNRDEEDPNIAWLHIIIPADVGGFWIREFGIYAEPLTEGGEPVLYAYGNHAPYYKLLKVNGQASTHELSIPIILTGTAEVEIAVKEVGYASQLALENLEKRLWENDGKGSLLLPSILPEGVLTTSRLLPGGGLALDADGQVFVDVDSMNEQRFEALLKALRVQKWLSGPLNIYVNQQTGSDTLDEGRGLSESKPFQTLQAALLYVSSTYNFYIYNVTVHIAQGYNSSVAISLPSYTTTSGTIIITGPDQNHPEYVKIGSVSLAKRVSYLIQDLTVDPQGVSPSTRGVLAEAGTISLQNIVIDLTDTVVPGAGSSLYAIDAISGGSVRAWATSSGIKNGINIKIGAGTSAGGNIALVRAVDSGIFSFAADISIEGSHAVRSSFYATNMGLITRGKSSSANPGRLPNVTATGTLTGRRYEVTANSIINTSGGGAEFFPGTLDGFSNSGGQYL